MANGAMDKRAKEKSGRARMLNFGEGLLGTIGALVVTFGVCYIVAMAALWIAGRIISIGGLRGTVPTAITALVLTVIVYLYDRDNP
jgi:energy-converting hydrogenase Eha subunit B